VSKLEEVRNKIRSLIWGFPTRGFGKEGTVNGLLEAENILNSAIEKEKLEVLNDISNPLPESYEYLQIENARLRSEIDSYQRLFALNKEYPIIKGFTKEDDGIGKWLSAALDDPKVCEEFKNDILDWFNSKS
jgi:hypothetical protein